MSNGGSDDQPQARTPPMLGGDARERWVVTGASSGIGHGLATRLAGEGVRVTACVRGEDEVEALRTTQAWRSEQLSTVAFDVRDNARIRAAAAASTEPVDVLVACAGVFGRRLSARDLDFDEAADLFSVNALGPLRTVQAFLPRLLRGNDPRVVLVSSELGSMMVKGTSNLAYRASKAALNKIVQALAADLESDGITVIALEPGWVRTPMGGPDAPLSVDESVSGILATVRALTIGDSGRFLDYRSHDVPW
jgi:NAD(P)-dependent dehydrogenase (short-subunit alcohol dehydrogenase family)